MDSILKSIKELLGINPNNTNFDTDCIFHINTAIFELRQIGVGPQEEPFNITGPDEKWEDYLEDEIEKLNAVKTFIYLKVKTLFDPPQGSALEAFNKHMDEILWRLSVEVDPGEQ